MLPLLSRAFSDGNLPSPRSILISMMGFMGIGPLELLLASGCLLAAVGVPIIAIVVGVSLSRKSKPDTAAEANAYLSAENQRLKEELARLKKEQG